MVSIRLVSKILKLKLQISKLSFFCLFISLGKKEVLECITDHFCVARPAKLKTYFWSVAFTKFYFVICYPKEYDFVGHVIIWNFIKAFRCLENTTHHNNEIKKNYCMTPFFGWGSTVSRLHSCYKETIYFLPLIPGVPGTHLINLGRIEVSWSWSYPMIIAW